MCRQYLQINSQDLFEYNTDSKMKIKFSNFYYSAGKNLADRMKESGKFISHIFSEVCQKKVNIKEV